MNSKRGARARDVLRIAEKKGLSKRGPIVKLSTRSRYGTRLILDLAEHYGQGFIQLHEIADRQGISLKYLEQMIIPLRKAGYVKSTRGAGGGYKLAKPPEKISVGEIVTLLEGSDQITECSARPETCERSEECLTRSLWIESASSMYGRLNSVTLSNVLESGKKV